MASVLTGGVKILGLVPINPVTCEACDADAASQRERERRNVRVPPPTYMAEYFIALCSCLTTAWLHRKVRVQTLIGALKLSDDFFKINSVAQLECLGFRAQGNPALGGQTGVWAN